MNIPQLENVLSLSTEERYQHFVSKVGDWQQLWILTTKEKNSYQRKTGEGSEYLTVWPHPDYATKIDGEWKLDCVATEIDFNSFVEKWIPDLERKGMKVGVFPDLNGNVWIIDPSELKDVLLEEAAQYE